MKISGFTIARNAIKFDYPIVESIQSIPACKHQFRLDLWSTTTTRSRVVPDDIR